MIGNGDRDIEAKNSSDWQHDIPDLEERVLSKDQVRNLSFLGLIEYCEEISHKKIEDFDLYRMSGKAKARIEFKESVSLDLLVHVARRLHLRDVEVYGGENRLAVIYAEWD